MNDVVLKAIAEKAMEAAPTNASPVPYIIAALAETFKIHIGVKECADKHKEIRKEYDSKVRELDAERERLVSQCKHQHTRVSCATTGFAGYNVCSICGKTEGVDKCSKS